MSAGRGGGYGDGRGRGGVRGTLNDKLGVGCAAVRHSSLMLVASRLVVSLSSLTVVSRFSLVFVFSCSQDPSRVKKILPFTGQLDLKTPAAAADTSEDVDDMIQKLDMAMQVRARLSFHGAPCLR